MSLIIHRCITCKQPDYWHDAGRTTTAGDQVDGEPTPDTKRRKCARHRKGWGPSEVAPRWSTETYETVTEVLEPGGLAAGNNVAGGSTSCNCDECWELYRQVADTNAGRGRHLSVVRS